MALSARDRRDLVSTIYAAALDPAEWQTVADRFAACLDGGRVHLFGFDLLSGRDLGAIVGGWDPDALGPWFDHFSPLNPYPPAAAGLPVGAVVGTDQLVPAEDLARSEYYNDFLRPQDDLASGTGVLLADKPDAFFTIGSMHPARHRERLDREAMEVISDLAPDLMQAWTLAGIVADHRLLRGEVLPDTGGTTMIVDTNLRPLYVSPAAERALDRGDLVQHRPDGCIALTGAAAQDWLDAACRLCAAGAPLVDHHTFPLDWHRIRLGPLDPDALGGWRGAFVLGLLRPALMIVIEQDETTEAPAAILERVHGLTRTEAEVALALTEGRTPAEIAEARQVSRHTVRNQIKLALSKCGLSRQTQLVALVARATG